jgi:hypothetical protein
MFDFLSMIPFFFRCSCSSIFFLPSSSMAGMMFASLAPDVQAAATPTPEKHIRVGDQYQADVGDFSKGNTSLHTRIDRSLSCHTRCLSLRMAVAC